MANKPRSVVYQFGQKRSNARVQDSLDRRRRSRPPEPEPEPVEPKRPPSLSGGAAAELEFD